MLIVTERSGFFPEELLAVELGELPNNILYFDPHATVRFRGPFYAHRRCLFGPRGVFCADSEFRTLLVPLPMIHSFGSTCGRAGLPRLAAALALEQTPSIELGDDNILVTTG